MLLTLFILFSIIGGITTFVVYNYEFLIDQKVWLFIAFIVQWVCMAGIMHSLLKSGRPLFKVEYS